MTFQVYFFTRSGNSERIAKKIADALTCDIYQIKDTVNWQGIRAYFKWITYASGKKPIEIICDGNPADADQLILISPLWGGRPTPTVNQFLSSIDKQKVHLITSASSSQLNNKSGFATVTTIAQNAKNEDIAIKKLADQLSK